MASQRDKRVEVSALLRAGNKVSEVANLVSVSRTTVYSIKKRMDDGEGVNRRAGSGRKSVVDRDSLRDAIQSSPSTSMRQHARRLVVGGATVRRAVAKMGGKSLVRVERPLLTPAIRAKRLERCQSLMNDLKSAPAGRVIIFSDEKTWTVDPVRNRRNDRYLSLGEVDESVRTLSTTKHPASVMSLGFIASNGAVMPLIWFPTGYRLTARDYEDKLANMLVPWISNTFDMSSVTVVLQQDGAPAHTSNRVQGFLHEQNFSFWPKNMWPPYSPDVNPLDYAFWPHIQAKACRVRHPNITALKTSVDREWMAMNTDYVVKTCKTFRRRLGAIIAADGCHIE